MQSRIVLHVTGLYTVTQCTVKFRVLGSISSRSVLIVAVYWALYRHVVYRMLLCICLYIVTQCTACCCVFAYIPSCILLRAAVYSALYRHVVILRAAVYWSPCQSDLSQLTFHELSPPPAVSPLTLSKLDQFFRLQVFLSSIRRSYRENLCNFQQHVTKKLRVP